MPTMIVYNGAEMTPDWPAKIRKAQKLRAYTVEAVTYPRTPYGKEVFWDALELEPASHPCRDCGVVPDQLHVPCCCVEECPVCHAGQWVTCMLEGCQ